MYIHVWVKYKSCFTTDTPREGLFVTGFTTSGELFRAAYYGALAAKQLTIMRN
jgi:hypothetical protein